MYSASGKARVCPIIFSMLTSNMRVGEGYHQNHVGAGALGGLNQNLARPLAYRFSVVGGKLLGIAAPPQSREELTQESAGATPSRALRSGSQG